MKLKTITLMIVIAILSWSAHIKSYASENVEEIILKPSQCYQDNEIEDGRVLALSNTTLNDLQSENQNIWFSVGEQTYPYKGNIHNKYVVTRVDFIHSSQKWNGEIALFPYTDKKITNIYKMLTGFSDSLGNPFDSVITFIYYTKCNNNMKPYAEIHRSSTGAGKEGNGYNHFTRRCFIDFVIKHTDAEFIISDARNPKSQHILSKPEFGFISAIGNAELSPYTRGMTTPYILSINRS